MATEHSGQTGVVTVASSHGLRHCPWKRCAQGMSCVSTRPRRQKGHRALDTEDSVRARFGGEQLFVVTQRENGRFLEGVCAAAPRREVFGDGRDVNVARLVCDAAGEQQRDQG